MGCQTQVRYDTLFYHYSSSYSLCFVETSAMEASFMQLIHILAHHPDFSVSNNDLALFMRYLQFFISCIAAPDNVASLYHVTQKIKLAKDVRSNDQSEVNTKVHNDHP